LAATVGLFEQHYVGDAKLGQVVGDAGADHAAANDDDVRAVGRRCGGHRCHGSLRQSGLIRRQQAGDVVH
jgi:hypothetical protein